MHFLKSLRFHHSRNLRWWVFFHGASPFQVAIAKLAEVERSSKSERERMRAEVEQEIEVGS